MDIFPFEESYCQDSLEAVPGLRGRRKSWHHLKWLGLGS